MGSPRNGIKQNKRPNKYSLKQIDKLNAELPVRVKLIRRCGGTPIYYNQTVQHNGTSFIIRRVRCKGGTCECGCNRQANSFLGDLHPHERLWRGRGGKVSLENSIMVLNECHERLQNRSPKLEWIKEE